MMLVKDDTSSKNCLNAIEQFIKVFQQKKSDGNSALNKLDLAIVVRFVFTHMEPFAMIVGGLVSKKWL